MMKKEAIAIVLGFLLIMSVSAQTQAPDFILANGTGEAITEIEIKPSRAKYRGNRNVCFLSGINVPDTATFGVSLPEQMKTMDSFDIVLRYGNRTAKTVTSITVIKNDESPPFFVLSIKDTNPTIPLIADATVAGIGVASAALKSASAAVVEITGNQTEGAEETTETLVIIGGSVIAGMVVIAAAPVLVGLGLFTALMTYGAKTLIVTPVDYIAP
jgi:hypothetical protein